MQDFLLASPAHAGMYPSPGIDAGFLARFPRTRGDVPAVAGWTAGVESLPPHTRGCTWCFRRIAGRWKASPAHAGMYPWPFLSRRPASRFPRTRGDVPFSVICGHRGEELPPHTRGCTSSSASRMVQASASPAHAGMYLDRRQVRAAPQRFPRTRGDVPRRSYRGRPAGRLPPHTRGCTRHPRSPESGFHASPAHAGMYRDLRRLQRKRCSFPRTRGDVPAMKKVRLLRSMLPPHTRGCTRSATGWRRSN